MTVPSSLALVGGDLNAVARVEGAARAAGLELRRTPIDRLASIIPPPALVVVDLDDVGVAAVAPLVTALADADLAPARVVAFYSHVDEAAGAAAREAGFRAMPRGRFWRELPHLVSDLQV